MNRTEIYQSDPSTTLLGSGEFYERETVYGRERRSTGPAFPKDMRPASRRICGRIHGETMTVVSGDDINAVKLARG
jgi:hypothetical protein